MTIHNEMPQRRKAILRHVEIPAMSLQDRYSELQDQLWGNFVSIFFELWQIEGTLEMLRCCVDIFFFFHSSSAK